MTGGARARAEAEQRRLLARCREAMAEILISALVAQRGPAALADVKPQR